MPSTVQREGTGTIVSPCEPRVSVCTEPTGTPSSSATLLVKRAVSSMPAWPMTRFFGKPVASCASAVISSSGLETTMTTASGEVLRRCSRRPARTIFALVSMRSIRLMPGLRGQAGGDDDDVGVLGALVGAAADADDLRLEALDRPRLVHVQRDALGLALDDVGEHDGLEDVVLGETERGGGAVETGADDGDLAVPGLLCHGRQPIAGAAAAPPGRVRRPGIGQRDDGQREPGAGEQDDVDRPAADGEEADPPHRQQQPQQRRAPTSASPMTTSRAASARR